MLMVLGLLVLVVLAVGLLVLVVIVVRREREEG